jgi:hypothetical protein
MITEIPNQQTRHCIYTPTSGIPEGFYWHKPLENRVKKVKKSIDIISHALL